MGDRIAIPAVDQAEPEYAPYSERVGARWKASTAKKAEPTFFRLFAGDLVRACVFILLLHVFVFQFSIVRGSSMLPNIEDGDRLLVDRISYSLLGVQRFDVVILAYPKDPTIDYVKRIIGLPGDMIELRNGELFVNGKPLPEPFKKVQDKYATGSWVVPADSYFVLGDNRPVSSDSREGWSVNRDLIKGKVQACIWPVARAKTF